MDANILIRAVLGSRVLDLLTKYAAVADFFAPDVALHEARKHLPGILEKCGIAGLPALTLLRIAACNRSNSCGRSLLGI